MDEEDNGLSVSEIGTGQPVIEKEWKPTPKQKLVLSIPDSVFEALGGGAAGGGKTDLGLMIPLARQFVEHPKFKGLVLRRTYTDLEKEIIPRQQEWYAPSGGTYNETKKVWKWPSGARIQNGHAEREQDVRKYDSAEYNFIDWDEVTHFTGFQYLYLSLSRCRSSSPDLPAFVRAFTNPGNVGHGFFKKRFVDPCPTGCQILRDKVTQQKRIYIPFLGIDNPFLLINDPNYLKRLEGLTETEKKAKLFGDWNSYEGQVFTEFRPVHIHSEPDNAIHVIKPLEIPDWWPRFLCVDWGFAAITYAIWAAVSPDGRVYIYRTHAWLRELTKIWARECANLTGNEELQDFVLCHSAGQHRGEEKTILQQVSEAFDDKYAIRLAEQDRIGGKALIHEYLRWEQKPKLKLEEKHYNHDQATKILRIKGESAYNEYMLLFVEEPPETNLPKLQILERSPEGREAKELIDVIPACIPSEKNPEDVAEFSGDDPYDCLRMVVKTAHRYADLSADISNRLNRVQAIIEKFKNSANATEYHRAMERLEAEVDSENSVARRRITGRR